MAESTTEPESLPRLGDPSRFIREGITANPVGAAQTRGQFEVWLKQYFPLSDERLNDVVLSVYEALANAAEFAYAYADFDVDTMDMQATHVLETDTLTVAVCDSGRWRGPALNPLPLDPLRARGRGIPLMQALADDTTITTATTGTRVTLVWTGLSGHR